MTRQRITKQIKNAMAPEGKNLVFVSCVCIGQKYTRSYSLALIYEKPLHDCSHTRS